MIYTYTLIHVHTYTYTHTEKGQQQEDRSPYCTQETEWCRLARIREIKYNRANKEGLESERVRSQVKAFETHSPRP